ncbi:helix-turn-helix domain-containing protein [Paenibacillus nasutitermitis]|uniref:AraC family transcriptional regulator n=1 Tax=Paenibacillus nasutitermitis TaxID=1652958 RepID=A0A916Z8V4_9BACL|nr:AraC family transcriptional regulator [Paenibacillus nasutitermitis]GGD80434.1 AraC family transcriptional regulator [Paenibacillus nasutitermitis]
MAHPPLPRRLTNNEYFSSSSFRIFHQQIDGLVTLHWHEFYEISFIVSGEGFNMVNGVSKPIAKGDLFLLTPADFHTIGPAPDHTLEIYNLIFSDEWMEPRMRELLFHNPLELSVMMEEEIATELVQCFSLILKESKHDYPGKSMMVRSALDRILIELYRACEAKQPEKSKTQPVTAFSHAAAIQDALVYIHHHFREPLSLEIAARQARLSPNYFSDCFRKTTGTAFQQYLQSLRLNFAKSLIQSSTLPISEISYISGFNTLTNFEKMFKRMFGDAPRSFRSKTENG